MAAFLSFLGLYVHVYLFYGAGTYNSDHRAFALFKYRVMTGGADEGIKEWQTARSGGHE